MKEQLHKEDAEEPEEEEVEEVEVEEGGEAKEEVFRLSSPELTQTGK